MKRRTTVLAAIAVPLWFGASPSLAQAYPTRPIRLVTPSPPGGAGDVANRVVAKGLSDELGQPVVIENRVGGNGVIAAQEALRGGNDGYTVFVGSTTTLAANPYLMKSMPYDPTTDFTAVSLIGTLPFVLVVNTALPVKSVKDLVAYAKANPGKVSYASANASSRVTASMLGRMTGIELLHIPYKSAPASLTDVVSGQVTMSFVDIPSSLGLIQTGKLRLLGVSSAKRLALLPDTPTIAEAGIPGYELVAWVAMVVPTGTDPAIVRRLSEATRKVIARPDVREQLAKVGFDAEASTPEALASFMRTERPRWARLIRGAKIDPE